MSVNVLGGRHVTTWVVNALTYQSKPHGASRRDSTERRHVVKIVQSARSFIATSVLEPDNVTGIFTSLERGRGVKKAEQGAHVVANPRT
jgi:hypothetical protein